MPDSPGVYLIKDTRGSVIYVGKAKKLSSRVRSYVQKPESLDLKTRALVRAATSVDYIATENEVEALVLECTLIKEYRPRYNIKLKDDKKYPFIKITVNERFPRILLERRVENDGAEYFGPYTDVKALRRILRLIRSVFRLRDCGEHRFSAAKTRECLNFQIGQCSAPCTGRIDESEYCRVVDQVRLFLRGRNEELLSSLRERMLAFSGGKRYEEAAVVRDQLESLERIAQKQVAVKPGGKDEDVVALAREGNLSCGVVMKVREGRILGTETFFIPAAASEPREAVFDAFLELYYHSATDIPPRIYAQFKPTESALLEDWLSRKIGRRVKILTVRGREKRKLMELGRKNAALKILYRAGSPRAADSVLSEVKETLGLPVTPFRIEAFDISNIQGMEAVGSMVTFENGKPLKSGYRRFKVRDVRGADDFAMIAEVLGRRFRHLKEGRERRPDLVLVDGGKGQVSAARRAMGAAEVTGIPVVGLAKKHEEIFVEGRKKGLRLSRRNDCLCLLQRIRNEAHRFAVEYHRKLMSGRLEHSELDEIRGVGTKRKIILIMEFGSLERLREAELERIASVPGIGEKLAEEIYTHLHA